jgi:hypothetical protein
VLDLFCSQSLGETGCTVEFIVMIETEEDKIVFRRIFVVAIDVSNLTLLNLVAPFQIEAQTTPSPASSQDVLLDFVRDRFPYHESASVANNDMLAAAMP